MNKIDKTFNYRFFVVSWLNPALALSILKLLGYANWSWAWCIFGPLVLIVTWLIVTLLGLSYICYLLEDDEDFKSAKRKAEEMSNDRQSEED